MARCDASGEGPPLHRQATLDLRLTGMAQAIEERPAMPDISELPGLPAISF